MAKDWKQIAKEQKLVIAELKALNREWQRMYARLEKAGWVALKRVGDPAPTRAGYWSLLEASDKASLFYFRETDRLGKLTKRLEVKKA
jgi:hypothetical protein